MMIEPVKTYLLDLQNRICQFIEKENGEGKFQEDRWQHHDSFGGITRVLTGNVVEKAGVNFSHVSAPSLPEAATLKRPELANAPFEALGVSVVIHPFNPYAPTCHMNVRCIIVKRRDDEPIWWFGGGFDLTPYYGFVEDCVHFHSEARAACLPFGEEVYPKYKKWADQYFFLKHRQEPRGIGGIFFDDLNAWGFERSHAFIQSVGNHFISAYQPILHQRKTHEFEKREKDFQLMRRGRYVEFNLLYDRGTLFGLQSGGRTESILMSLPPLVAWQYANESSPNTDEVNLIEKFLKPRDWV